MKSKRLNQVIHVLFVESSHVEKEAAGRSIAELVDDGMIVGLGTGTTVAHAIVHLGRRIADEGLSISGVPTSYQSMLLAIEHRVPLRPFTNTRSSISRWTALIKSIRALTSLKEVEVRTRARKSLRTQHGDSASRSMPQNSRRV